MLTVDSSSLISFAKIGKTELIQKLNKEIICPEEVYKEVVNIGIKLGYPDAIKIKKLFDNKIIRYEKLNKPNVYTGVSKTDSKVITMASKTKNLLCDDLKLSRRAKSENINVKNTADALLDLKNKDQITNFEECLEELLEKERISEETFKHYKRLGGKK